MPPKKPVQAAAGSKKTQEKKKEKIIEVKSLSRTIAKLNGIMLR